MKMELSIHIYHIKYTAGVKHSGLGAKSIPCLFLYGLRGKNVFHIFKWLQNYQEKDILLHMKII